MAQRFHGARPHAEITGVRTRRPSCAQGADGLVALGGGSVMDTTKAVSVQTGLPMVSIPTTYAGAEWTPFFGVRDEQTRTKDAGFDARVEGIVYEPGSPSGMPPTVTAGTALNALTHCAEALYVPDRTDESDEHALRGAALIARHLPAVLDDGRDLEARTGLLEGAMHGGAALRVGMGARPRHGAVARRALRRAARRHERDLPAAGAALQRRGRGAAAIAHLAEAMAVADPVARIEELAAIASRHPPARLRRARATTSASCPRPRRERGAAKANPQVASVEEIRELFDSVW